MSLSSETLPNPDLKPAESIDQSSSDISSANGSNGSNGFDSSATDTTRASTLSIETEPAQSKDSESEGALRESSAAVDSEVADESVEKTPTGVETQDVIDDLSDPEEEQYSYLRSLRYGFNDPREPLKERVKKAPVQMKNVMQYTRLMEERVHALEIEVEGLKTKKETKSDPEPEIKPTTPSKGATGQEKPRSLQKYGMDLKPEIRRTTGKYFSDCTSEYVVDVLIEEPEDSFKTQKSGVKVETSTVGTEDRAIQRPSRIKIDSVRIRYTLNQLTGEDVFFNTRLFLPPFLFFTQYEDAIRQHEKTLEAQCRSTKATHGNGEPLERKLFDKSEKHDVTGPLEQQSSFSEGNNADPKDNSDDEDDDEEPEVGEDERGAMYLVMEKCQISAKKAFKAMEKSSSGTLASPAVSAARNDMSREKLDIADHEWSKILLPEWRTLIQLLDNNLKSTLATCCAIREGTLKEIAFDDLSYLFKPGDVVVASQDSGLQALGVLAVSGGRKLLGEITDIDLGNTERSAKEAIISVFDTFLHPTVKYSPFIVDCYYYDFDGSNFGPMSRSVTVPKYKGTVPITSLAVYPIKFRRDGEDLRGELVTRGDHFVKLCSLTDVSHKQYIGRTLDDPPEEVDSEVIVDCHLASTLQSSSRPHGETWTPTLGLAATNEADDDEASESISSEALAKIKRCGSDLCVLCNGRSPIFRDQQINKRLQQRLFAESPNLKEMGIKADELDNDDRALLPYRLFGFVLRSKKWARLNIYKIDDLEYDDANFDKLVLPSGYREIVHALVKTHSKEPQESHDLSKPSQNFDLVRGKGKGLVILLHGAPGVGKTSTAECIAAYTHRPLYALTCGDIGETARDVEESLEKCFQLAHKWGCVLLLDEADVFLAKRDKTDLRRNALVSVFLRVLEYYAGILFLTTNRVATFDDAFRSRIHMSFYYPALDKTSTSEIWKKNVDRIKGNFKHIEVDETELRKYGESHYKKAGKYSGRWNGRQIRNAFQTAIALAEWEMKARGGSKIRLTKEHFIKVADASRDFDTYLKEVHDGADEGERAAEERIRADWITRSKPKKASSKSTESKKKSRDKAEDSKASRKKSKKKQESESDDDSGKTSEASESEESSS